MYGERSVKNNKHPLRSIGTVFACIAGAEAAALLAIHAISGVDGVARMVLTLVFGIQILVFGGIGAGFLLYVRGKERLRERLIAEGECTMARVASTECVYNVQMNGRNPYRIVCRIERGGVLHEYRSDMLPFDPALPVGSEVPVYFDRYDENKYVVDVGSVAPIVIRH